MTKKILLTALILLGVLIRFYHLGTNGLNLDELVSANLARSGNMRWFLDDTNPPLYHWLLRSWLALVPPTEFWLRSLSVFFSTGALAFTAQAALSKDRHAPSLWNLLPVFFLALLPLSVHSAQEARMGALWEFFSAMGLWAVVRTDRRSYGVAAVGAVMTQWLGALSAFLEARNLWMQSRKIGWIGGAVVFALAFSLALNATSYHLDWQIHRYKSVPLAREVFEQIENIFSTWWAAALGVVLFGTAYRRRKFLRFDEGAFLTVAVFLLMLLGLSVLHQRSLFLERYAAGLAPFIAWAWAAGLQAATEHKVFRAVGTVLFSLGLGLGLARNFQRPVPVWREALLFTHQQDPLEIWTTRPIATGFPYLVGFEERMHTFTGGGEELERLFQGLRSGRRLAFIENFWGGLLYLEPLKVRAQAVGVPLREQVFAERTDEPVKVLIFNP